MKQEGKRNKLHITQNTVWNHQHYFVCYHSRHTLFIIIITSVINIKGRRVCVFVSLSLLAGDYLPTPRAGILDCIKWTKNWTPVCTFTRFPAMNFMWPAASSSAALTSLSWCTAPWTVTQRATLSLLSCSCPSMLL